MPTQPVALSVQELGKRYRVGKDARGAHLLAEHVSRSAARAVRRVRGRPVDDLRPEHRWLWALRGVSFDVHFGETLGVVGRNGAGKSTLLKLLAQITVPTEGRIVRYGKVTGLLEVGSGFHPELTGRENVFLNASLLGMSRRETARRFDEIVDFSGVEEFLEMPVKRYSSGMYMRLAFSVASHLEPEILLVDEVLSVGDAAFQNKCLAKLKAVTQQGRTVVFVSHGLGTVQQLCDRVLLLERGNLELEGNPEAVVTEYVDRIEEEEQEEQQLDGAVSANADDHWVPAGAHRTGDRRAQLVRVRMSGLDGVPLETVSEGAAFRISCTFEIHEPIPDAIFELGLATVEGQRMATAYSADGGLEPVALEPGTYEIGADLPAEVFAGEYLVQAGMLRAGDGEAVDLVERALRLHVVPATNPPAGTWVAPRRSCLRLAPIWSEPEPAADITDR